MELNKNINIKASSDLHNAIRQHAFDKRISQAEVVRRAIKEYLEREKNNARNTK